MKRKRRLSVLLSATFAASVVLAGCSSSTTSSGNTTKAVKPLVIGAPNGNWQENFNPFTTNPLYGSSGLIYQPLYIFNTVAHVENPVLATKYAWINNNKTLEVTLRDGVKW